MNKPFLRSITVACTLLVSTVGPSATVLAEENAHSPIYRFDVMHEGEVVGVVKVNTVERTPSYVLVVDGLTPNTKYTFGYSVESEYGRALGFADTKKTGALRMHATFPLRSLQDLGEAQFWVAETGVGDNYDPYYYGQPINSVYFEQDGWFIAKLQFYYSEDEGQTWKWSAQTDNLLLYDTMEFWFADKQWVPDNALVRVHVEVVGGKDRTDSRVFRVTYTMPWYTYDNYQACYNISGVTWNPDLEYYGTLNW